MDDGDRQCCRVDTGASADRVFVSTRGNTVVALARPSGKESWRTRTGSDVATHPGGEHWDYFSSSPIVAGSAVIVGSGDGQLHALRADSGAVMWTFRADGRIRGSPRVKDGTVVFGTIRGSVYVVSVADGRLHWRFETDGYRIDSAAAGFDRTSVIASAAFSDDLVYIGGRDGRFYALSIADGRERWRAKYEPSWVIAAAAVAGDMVIVATSDAQCVAAMDATSGQERWRYDAKARVLSSPAVAGDQVQVGLESGTMVSLDLSSGAERWRYQTDGPILSSPALASGVVVVGSDDGGVYAWRESARGASRAVFWDASRRTRAFTPDVSERIAKHFAAAGYETLAADLLATYLRERIADKRPSVVVFALDDLPDDVAGDPNASLLRQYLEAGGNAIWPGVVPPGYVRRNADGKPVEIRADAPLRITGVAHDLGNGDAYGLTIAPGGTALGLTTWWLARGEARSQDGTTVLATDEFGRAAAWVKGYSGPPGTGFVRLWGMYRYPQRSSPPRDENSGGTRRRSVGFSAVAREHKSDGSGERMFACECTRPGTPRSDRCAAVTPLTLALRIGRSSAAPLVRETPPSAAFPPSGVKREISPGRLPYLAAAGRPPSSRMGGFG